MSRATVAVVGSGVAGLTAAYLLARRYDVMLFEADDRLGGHAHTHEVPGPAGRMLPIDSGFIVYNERTYPNLIRLFGELGVTTQRTEMSMSISCRECGLEYAGAKGPRGLFAQRSSLTDRRYLRMLTEVVRFHRNARRLLDSPGSFAGDEPTFGEFLATYRHSEYFVAHFAVPLVSAVWSTGAADALRYPARYLFVFLRNHGMLSVSGAPQWRTVVGGSQRYVQRAVKDLTAVRTSTPVRAVIRHGEYVAVRDDSDTETRFDSCVVATHADQALRILDDPTPAERSVLGAFRSSVNHAVLHTDARMLPAARAAWASWNHVSAGCSPNDASGRVSITYHMNRLQRLGGAASDTQYLVTLGGEQHIRQHDIIARMTYEHPIYTPESVNALQRLPGLGGKRLTFAGAWQGWGFHEDGCRSGVEAARRLGVSW